MSFLPLVSVIVPTRNSSSTLEACLQSLAYQTYKNIELIVVDNFSTDNTQAVRQKAWEWSREITFNQSYKDFVEIILK